MYKIILVFIFTLFVHTAYSQCTSQSIDSDQDGICDILDQDDDNDGIIDSEETFCSSIALSELTFNGVAVTTNLPSKIHLSDNDNLWRNSYSTETFSLPIDFQFKSNTKFISMIGLLPVGASETLNTWNDGSYKAYIHSNGQMYGKFPNIWTFISPIENEQIVKISIAIDGILTIVVGEEIIHTGTAPIEDYKLTVTSYNGGSVKDINLIYGGILCTVQDIDTDQDNIPNRLDLDSDNDLCVDAFEGGGDFGLNDMDNVGRLLGGINTVSNDANYGVPLVVGNGQSLGHSKEKYNISPDIRACQCPTGTVTNFPTDKQLYARDITTNSADIIISGEVTIEEIQQMELRVFRENILVKTLSNALSFIEGIADYSFNYNLIAERANYRFELHSYDGNQYKLMKTANDIVAGDVYIIDGQSNAEARLFTGSSSAYIDSFIRVYGTGVSTTPQPWHIGQGDGNRTTDGNTGQWGLVMANLLSTKTEIPIALFNGAHGGTRISFHARNDSNPTDLETNYGRLLHRLELTNLADAVRGIFWYQGESDRANTQDYYESRFDSLYQDWKTDFPNVEQFYTVQIRTGCGAEAIEVINIQEALRNQSSEKLDMKLMTTKGIATDGCHYPFENGYDILGTRLANLLENDLYNGINADVEAPNILSAVVLQNDSSKIKLIISGADSIFIDQGIISEFEIPNNQVLSATVQDENKLILQLEFPVTDTTSITYYDSSPKFSAPHIKDTQGIGLASFKNFPVKEDIALNAKILLEGFYDLTNGNMPTKLGDQNLLPLSQPFNTTPWNYNGMEKTTSIPSGVVDWILIATRDSNGDIINQAAGFVNQDGTLISVDGHQGIPIPDAMGKTISVHHKSHLAVISSAPYDGGVYDFTTAANQAEGTEQLKLIDGKYMLYSGDYDGTGIINSNDFNKWKIQGAVLNQYLNIDGDGNGIVNSLDFNLWQINKSKVGQPSIRY